MASSKHNKKSGKKRSGRAADAAAVNAAATALAEGAAIPTLGTPEVEALAQRLTAARDPDALDKLAGALTDKAQLKVVKRALYKLGQAGVAAGAAGARKPAKKRSGGGSGEMPILMTPPGPDARRVFTFLVEDKPSPFVVEAYFCVPEGLFRLQSSPSDRAGYLPWAKGLLASRDAEDMGVPGRVAVGRDLLQRKLWEIGLHVSEGSIGTEVDLALARKLSLRRSPPRHPAMDLALDGGRVLDAVALSEKRYRVRSLFHHVPMLELRRQWRELGGAALVSSSVEVTGMGAAVREWLGQWGYEFIEEHLLDLTSFFHGVGDLDAAATFKQLATSPGSTARREGIDQFMRDWLVHHLSTSSD